MAINTAPNTAPELASVEAFVEHLLDDDRTNVTTAEVGNLSAALRRTTRAVLAELRGYGVALAERPVARSVRGFRTSSHDRWFGPGACPTHGGSGWEQVAGFAGQEG